ncbi:Transthyretin-like family protein [Teladorsagia circumcincta]|uniref:Transthyretin-like family protein n=1 Tax=Teladorsagia circumcincta TaxID=45464 RepID=A0A2G9UVK4_TELCI|nr:Transthyretin-like family protein [Teladorsagia circumcincta]
MPTRYKRVLDSKLDETRTNGNGEFRLSGHKREISTIDPKVNIYHKCNYHGIRDYSSMKVKRNEWNSPEHVSLSRLYHMVPTFCYKKLSITIPDNFVTSGGVPRATYDIGTINLANKFKGESIDCIN